MMSVSERFARAHAALVRTFVDRSSRAARIMLAVSATNITSCEERFDQTDIISSHSAQVHPFFVLTACWLIGIKVSTSLKHGNRM